MRLFVAIPLSEEMKNALVGVMHDLKKQGVEGNYVPAQNLHITLARKARARMPYQIRLPKCGMTAKEASLMQSVPRGNGVLYKIM